VNCPEARLLIGAAPASTTPPLEEHLAGCAECARFRAEMQTLDGDIRRALQTPPELSVRPRRAAPPPVWRRWALAASVLVAMAASSVWLLLPSDTLAHDLVSHVEAESGSWASQEQLDSAGITNALRAAGVGLDVTSDKITYAHSCRFRGHYVPHLVLQTDKGPVTVMLLRHEQVRAPQTFREEGLSGIIVPAENGSIALLAQGDAGLEPLARQMRQDVRWLPEAR
jgi:hypothetical protein